jgi:hypothetical protein
VQKIQLESTSDFNGSFRTEDSEDQVVVTGKTQQLERRKSGVEDLVSVLADMKIKD